MTINTLQPDCRTQSIITDLTTLWDASVRTTHHFLTDDDITSLRPFVIQGLTSVPTLCVAMADDGSPLGFMGLDGGKIEMLFVGPEHQGRGVGGALFRHAINALGATDVDVNEQNEIATAVYIHMGFRVIGRDAKDAQGNDFPILHMKL